MPPKLQTGAESVRIALMVPETWLDPVETWRRRQTKIPTRAEAIRRLVEIGLAAEGVEGAYPGRTRGGGEES
jgi:hypothetical protein